MAGRSAVAVRRAMFCLADFEKQARARLDDNAWGYYSSGADQEQTLRDNELAFSRSLPPSVILTKRNTHVSITHVGTD